MGPLLRIAGYERLRRWGARLTPLLASPPADSWSVSIRTDRMVRMAAGRVPVASACLSRSLTLWLMLRIQGIESELYLGVRRGADELDAHAWVEHLGRPLNDTVDVHDRFTTIHSSSSS